MTYFVYQDCDPLFINPKVREAFSPCPFVESYKNIETFQFDSFLFLNQWILAWSMQSRLTWQFHPPRNQSSELSLPFTCGKCFIFFNKGDQGWVQYSTSCLTIRQSIIVPRHSCSCIHIFFAINANIQECQQMNTTPAYLPYGWCTRTYRSFYASTFPYQSSY